MSERIRGANGDRMRGSTRMRRVSRAERMTEGVSVEKKRREETGTSLSLKGKVPERSEGERVLANFLKTPQSLTFS